MRKRNKGRILSRSKSQRESLLRSLAASLFLHGKIKTTQAKAKELRVVVEKCITKAKNGSTIENRRLLALILAPKVVKKVVDEIALQYTTRNGGYTRIVKLGPRKSDGAKMVIIELVK